jgi:hypothetical protein
MAEGVVIMSRYEENYTHNCNSTLGDDDLSSFEDRDRRRKGCGYSD